MSTRRWPTSTTSTATSSASSRNTAGARPGATTRLPPRERSILNLGMIASLGRMEEFQTHVRGALNNGMTPNEIRAVLTQIAVYCGIPVRRRLLPPRQAGDRRVSEEQEVEATMLDQPDKRGATVKTGRPRARLPAAPRGAGGGGAGGAHRSADRQGHRAACAGALAVRRRPARGQAARLPVHQRGRRQRPALRHAGGGRRARGLAADLRHRHGPAGRRDRRRLDRRDRPSDPAGAIERRALPGGRHQGRRTEASPTAGSKLCRCRSRRPASTPRPISPPRSASPRTPRAASRTWAPTAPA